MNTMYASSSMRGPLAISAVLSLLLAIAEATSTVKVVDTAGDVSQEDWNQAKADGFEVAIPRGVCEACNEGGALDPYLLSNIERATTAGFSSIETYLYPCSSTEYSCKTPDEQVALITNAISGTANDITRIWIQVGAPGNECPLEWNMGPQGNGEYLHSLIQAVVGAGYEPGVYANYDSWVKVFGSAENVVDSSVPLWFAHHNALEDLNIELPFGGWGAAVGHQYGGPATSVNGQFHLSIFECETQENPSSALPSYGWVTSTAPPSNPTGALPASCAGETPTEPEYNAPTPEPIQEAPATEPKYDVPASEPNEEAPATEPEYNVPVSQPIQEEAPASEPKYDVPAPEPTKESPAPQPTKKAPAPQPTKEAPAPEPEYEAPGGSPGNARMSEEGISLLKKLEGFRAEYYWLFGEKHIGYGHNCDQLHDCDGLKTPITEKEGDELLRKDLSFFEDCTCQLPNASKLNVNQYSALVSFAFNSGCGGLEEYTSSYLSGNDFDGFCKDLPGINILDGYLVTRREQESGLCSGSTTSKCGC